MRKLILILFVIILSCGDDEPEKTQVKFQLIDEVGSLLNFADELTLELLNNTATNVVHTQKIVLTQRMDHTFDNVVEGSYRATIRGNIGAVTANDPHPFSIKG